MQQVGDGGGTDTQLLGDAGLAPLEPSGGVAAAIAVVDLTSPPDLHGRKGREMGYLRFSHCHRLAIFSTPAIARSKSPSP